MTEEYRKQLGQLTQLRIRSHSFMVTILKVVEILRRLEHLGVVGCMQHLCAAGRVDRWPLGNWWPMELRVTDGLWKVLKGHWRPIKLRIREIIEYASFPNGSKFCERIVWIVVLFTSVVMWVPLNINFVFLMNSMVPGLDQHLNAATLIRAIGISRLSGCDCSSCF